MWSRWSCAPHTSSPACWASGTGCATRACLRTRQVTSMTPSAMCRLRSPSRQTSGHRCVLGRSLCMLGEGGADGHLHVSRLMLCTTMHLGNSCCVVLCCVVLASNMAASCMPVRGRAKLLPRHPAPCVVLRYPPRQTSRRRCLCYSVCAVLCVVSLVWQALVKQPGCACWGRARYGLQMRWWANSLRRCHHHHPALHLPTIPIYDACQ